MTCSGLEGVDSGAGSSHGHDRPDRLQARSPQLVCGQVANFTFARATTTTPGPLTAVIRYPGSELTSADPITEKTVVKQPGIDKIRPLFGDGLDAGESTLAARTDMRLKKSPMYVLFPRPLAELDVS